MYKSRIVKIMNKKLYCWIWLFAVLFAVGCEDLEDTYDDFTDGGMIRYLGKCSDVEVVPGWERLRVVWKNSIDAGIKYTRVTWQAESDDKPFERLVEYDPERVSVDPMDTVYLEGLSDATYTVTISNISADSTASLVETTYVRPYTETHEDLGTFTRGITSFYRLGDKLAVVLDEDNENLKSLTLTYWGTDQQEHVWDVKQHMSDSVELGVYNAFRKYMRLLPEDGSWGIDFSQPLTIKREGQLVGCIDDVPFRDEVLDLNERIFSTGFSQLLTREYGPDWESQIDAIEEIDLDYDMSSFQDLLYFPNLKTVNLGKNRFMIQGHTGENGSVTDDYLGLMTLQFLQETRGTTINRYNDQYFQNEVEVMGVPMPYTDILMVSGDIGWTLLTDHYGYNANYQFMPDIEPLDTTGWRVTCSDTVYNGYKTNGAGWLLDGDPTTCFEPGQTLATTVFEVEFDMQEAQVVDGFKFVQPDPTTTTATELAYLLESVKVEVSVDGYTWEQATYESGGSTIGDALGETTFIEVPEELRKPVRYIRLTIANKHTSEISGGTPLYSLRLGDCVPYTIR